MGKWVSPKSDTAHLRTKKGAQNGQKRTILSPNMEQHMFEPLLLHFPQTQESPNPRCTTVYIYGEKGIWQLGSVSDHHKTAIRFRFALVTALPDQIKIPLQLQQHCNTNCRMFEPRFSAKNMSHQTQDKAQQRVLANPCLELNYQRNNTHIVRQHNPIFYRVLADPCLQCFYCGGHASTLGDDIYALHCRHLQQNKRSHCRPRCKIPFHCYFVVERCFCQSFLFCNQTLILVINPIFLGCIYEVTAALFELASRPVLGPVAFAWVKPTFRRSVVTEQSEEASAAPRKICSDFA